MKDKGEEGRFSKRSYIEPYDTNSFLEFFLGGKEYRFNLLDTSPDGIGMLVKPEEDVLKKLKLGSQIRMKYCIREASMFMNFEVRHITPIIRGNFKNHYQVGLCMLNN